MWHDFRKQHVPWLYQLFMGSNLGSCYNFWSSLIMSRNTPELEYLLGALTRVYCFYIFA